MADEPRRSGRPTKGVHTKMDLQDTPTGGKKKGGKRGKKQAAPEEEEEEVIRCVCGVEADEDTGEAWIACDNCGVWQHNVCVGVSTFEDEIPANYKCEQCDPDFHRPLLDAMARGEELWEIRKIEHRKLEEEGSKKKGKRGKGNKRLSDQKLEPNQSANANGKAKSPSTPVPELKKKDTPAKGSSKRKARDESHDKESAKVQKTSTAQTPKQKSPPSDLPANITDLSTIRQGPAKLILKGLNHAIPIAVKNGVYTYSQGDNLKAKAERLAIQIENAIYTTHPSTSYGHQARAIAANLKINQDLCNRLLTKSLTPNALAGMTSDDMQSKELKQQTAEMKARADKQAIMVTEDDGPRIRRTHKGDEVVEGDDIVPGDIPVSSRQRRRSMMDPNADMATRSRENSPGDEANPPENINDYPSQDDIRGHVQPKGPLKVETKPTPARKQLAPNNFDINTVYKKVQAGSPTTASHIRRPSANIPAASTQHDPDIDRLLEDDGNESPPYSPAEYNSDPEVIWHGEVNMDSIAKFAGVAKHVAGADMTQSATNPLQWSDVLPKDLRVAGRIDQDKANEYLCSLRYSPPTDVVVVNITPTGEQAGNEFKVMFEYFYSKNRYGVLTNKGIGNIRDTYLVPVAPSPAALPDFLVNLEGHKVPDNRPDPLILAALVIRTHWDEQHHLQSFDGSSEAQSPSLHNRPVRQLSMSTPGPAMSPIAPQNASFSSNNPPSQLANPSQHPPVTPEQIERESRQQHGEDTAKQILGVHINAPTIAFLLPQAFQMRTVEWEVIRGILETDDKARIDLQHLSQVLELRMAQQAQSQGTPTGQPTPPT